MAERKAFNIIKAVPGVGHVYGAVRGAVYASMGDTAEAKHSVSVDLADLNPLRIPRNLAHGIVNATNELNEGAWIGRRPIGHQFVGLNITPGADGSHWCIQINGIIYQLVAGKDHQIKILISSKDEKREWFERDCKTYSWYLIKKDMPYFDRDVLREYAKSFEGYQYQAFLALGEKVNCQSFTTQIFAKAAGLPIDKARGIILLVMPNLLF